MAVSLDTICGLHNVPLGCPITFVVEGLTAGGAVRLAYGPPAGPDTTLSLIGDLTADGSGVAFGTLTSALSFSGSLYAHVPSTNVITSRVAGPWAFAWTGAGTCAIFLTTPVLTAEAVDGETAQLDWTAAVPCDARLDPVTYSVRRDGVSIASGLTGTSYTDSGLSPLTTYSYQVIASTHGILTRTANSNTVSVTTPAGEVVFDGIRYRLGASDGIVVAAEAGSIAFDEIRFRIR